MLSGDDCGAHLCPSVEPGRQGPGGVASHGIRWHTTNGAVCCTPTQHGSNADGQMRVAPAAAVSASAHACPTIRGNVAGVNPWTWRTSFGAHPGVGLMSAHTTTTPRFTR